MSTEDRRAFIESLAAQNRDFYGTPDGRGTLRAFELTFEHRWIYVFELVQNALDAGARSIALRVSEDGDRLEFQHDGKSSLDERDVEGLSKVFRSTKGASSVGFMGIGFKSVFGRFREARISGWGWTFRYEVAQVVGQTYGDVQLDLIGAVSPIWDPRIPPPKPGFTTRFELSERVDPEADLRSDLTNFLPEEDRTALAILAAAGLERLEVDGRAWELGVNRERDGSLEATALSEGQNLLWQLFPVHFEPSRPAIARFLEHRRIQPAEDERERVYAEAARARQVLGVLPLDDAGLPAPPKRGRVYATLPTEVTLPFGLHINADWLLNISRTGLREIEENSWQRDIVDRIADVLARFLEWASQACDTPEFAARAFSAVAAPSPADENRIETLLAQERWTGRLHALLEGAAVFPAWAGSPTVLSFVKPDEVITPPQPLAEAFEEEPALLPSVLVGGPVLAREVLGDEARALLTNAGFLNQMQPDELRQAWADGLEPWWQALPAEDVGRRDLLFRLWGALGELSREKEWAATELPCVRTAGGQWLPVEESAFFNEALPSDREPGGDATRRLVESFLPDARACISDQWTAALRQSAGKEAGYGPLSVARDWIERRAQAIDLRKAIESAVEAHTAGSDPDRSLLVPLGHWAMNRARPDLLSHVLVDGSDGATAVPTRASLVADPYVERGEGRRRLFPGAAAVSGAYVEQDPKGNDAHAWRLFLERAGAQGTLGLKVIEAEAGRYEKESVAEFLGRDLDEIGESNNAGYALLDFDIEPPLPTSEAPQVVLRALAVWLEDGYSALRGKGRRKIAYSYYGDHELTGPRASSWVEGIATLAWVPCDDGQLRLPKEVLPQPDPAREGFPVARLSVELVEALEREGLQFGTSIPEAPALRRLLVLGSQLSAEELAQLLGEIREQAAPSEEVHHFREALAGLLVPTRDGRRVSLDRVVQRVGGGARLRGGLGGWTVPLGDIPEPLRAELSDPTFPLLFPDTTTGSQALEFILDVWRRAQSSPERLANEVRDILPAAYAYCLEDIGNDMPLAERWKQAAGGATVFADREWIRLAESTDPVFLDDLEDRRFVPGQTEVRIASAGHLGKSLDQQIRTAEALGLERLSTVVEMEWREKGSGSGGDWSPRFNLVCHLLAGARGGEGEEPEAEREIELRRAESLDLSISVNGAAAERVPVNARLEHGVLVAAGRPVLFAADAAKELLRGFGFRQRGDLAADLTGMLGAIDDPSDFATAVDKFVRSFAPGFSVPPAFQSPTADLPAESGETPGSGDARGPDEEGTTKVEEGGTTPAAVEPGGSFDRDRALAQQNALAERLKKALKGEIEPDDEGEAAGEDEAAGDEGAGELGDEVYRQIAAQYERLCGREPDLGDPHQPGWDLRSRDPATGAERLIEVKGKGCPWTQDEVVELSRAQVRKAFTALAEHSLSTWYLYVVERAAEDTFEVLPIPNPVQLAGKWILRGEGWRMVTEEPRQVSFVPGGSETAE